MWLWSYDTSKTKEIKWPNHSLEKNHDSKSDDMGNML